MYVCMYTHTHTHTQDFNNIKKKNVIFTHKKKNLNAILLRTYQYNIENEPPLLKHHWCGPNGLNWTKLDRMDLNRPKLTKMN